MRQPDRDNSRVVPAAARSLRRARRAAGLGATVLAATLLAGCGQGVPPVVEPSASTGPNLTTAQESSIRRSAVEALEKADKSRDPRDLQARVSGPALAIRTAQLAVAKATGEADPHAIVPDDVRQIVVPRQERWPRTSLAITTATADRQTERLLVMEQPRARDNYKIWGIVRIFSGVELPKFEVPEIGSETLAGDDDSAAISPDDAAGRYADVLQNGSRSRYARQFADDPLREELAELTEGVQAGVRANGGSQSQSFSPEDGGLRVVRTADGGALAVAEIRSRWTRSSGDGRTARPASPTEQALMGDRDPAQRIVVDYVNLVAFHIPAKSAGGSVEVVGAERYPTKVSPS